MKFSFLVALAALAWLPSCSSTRTVGASNNVVHMDSHTFTIPPDRGWQCQEQSGPQHTYLQFEDGQVIYRAGIFFRAVDDSKLQAYSADELAALYFRNEEKRVLKADGGRYEIRDRETGTEALGGSLFYTHSYTAAAEDFEGQTFLFLRIPFERDNAALMAVEFRQATSGPPLVVDPTRLADVRAIAASLSLEEPSFAP